VIGFRIDIMFHVLYQRLRKLSKFENCIDKKDIKQAKVILEDIEPIHQGHKRGTITNKNVFVNCPPTNVHCSAFQRVFNEQKSNIMDFSQFAMSA